MTLTPEEKSMLAEAERLAAKATPEPWLQCTAYGARVLRPDGEPIMEIPFHHNRRFVIFSRTAVPALAAALRREAAVAEELAAVVRAFEDAGAGLSNEWLDARDRARALSPVARQAIETLASGSGISAASPANTSAKPSGVSRTTGARDGGAK